MNLSSLNRFYNRTTVYQIYLNIAEVKIRMCRSQLFAIIDLLVNLIVVKLLLTVLLTHNEHF